jgi:hypothetical protein
MEDVLPIGLIGRPHEGPRREFAPEWLVSLQSLCATLLIADAVVAVHLISEPAEGRLPVNRFYRGSLVSILPCPTHSDGRFTFLVCAAMHGRRRHTASTTYHIVVTARPLLDFDNRFWRNLCIYFGFSFDGSLIIISSCLESIVLQPSRIVVPLGFLKDRRNSLSHPAKSNASLLQNATENNRTAYGFSWGS